MYSGLCSHTKFKYNSFIETSMEGETNLCLPLYVTTVNPEASNSEQVESILEVCLM